MKNKIVPVGLKVAVAAAVLIVPLLAQAAAADAAKAAPKAGPKEPEPVKSVFATDPKKGKDPFFPRSERWDPPPKIEVVKTPDGKSTPPPPPPKKDPYKHFELKGFVGSGNNRVVTVSSGVRNYIVVLGESKMANTPEGPYRFKIVRYTDTGVVIQIEGFEKEEKELKLPTP